ncbi:hypothetical protein CK203_064024 [Vitis vinifera]|uniref:DUF4283 domain-containing protein n=1 Tax=Vitis vinifera TaxID=29760 RepID=A0A438FRE4_VITVI|nr:hypothetical protein CK203_064024 [Vitis vinifera]
MRESEGFREVESKEGESRAENRGRRKGNRFVVESKMFEVEAEERNGKRHVVISESKGELVSWVRLGPASVGLFIEGLTQCLRNGEEGRWEKGWKEKGRCYSMVREVNRAGSFIRLGVTDMEKRRFGICIPRGGKEKGGWVAVIEALRREGLWLEEKESDQGVRESCKLYTEVVKGSELRDITRFRVETKEEETKNNVSRLKQCLIGKWSPSLAREEDLASLGWAAARVWGLKGKLGLARLGKGCALLEFEKVEEAKRVLASGARLVGGIQMGLEVWSPKFGCASEGEDKKEAWVRILGLPISLWVPSILKRMGEACGGFLDVDPLTERKEDLEWARIKVKLSEGVLPSSMEIGVEGEVYVVSLWWEISPEIRKKKGDGRDGCGRQRGEVRGGEEPRAGWRVGENLGAAPKEQRWSEDGTGEQVSQFENWAQIGRATRQSSGFVGDGSSSSGLGCDPVGQKRDYGPTTQGMPSYKRDEWAATGKGCGLAEGRASEGLELLSHGPAIKGGGCLGQPQVQKTGTDYEDVLGLKLEVEFIKWREKEASGMQQPALQCPVAERAIMDEALRYGSDSNLKAVDSSSPSSTFFGRTPEREFCDHSGEIRAGLQKENKMELAALGGPTASREGCWDLIELNCDALEVQNPECTPVMTGSQAQRSEKETKWEDSSLAKFSKLLGFSVEGLEREILDFLSKIRKRRERIHSKGLLEKSKFERELKRLECSVKYKENDKKNSHLKSRGGQLCLFNES